ncbi:MAG TPA: alpha/beta hydrolase-fold protein [Gemmataceae bacterium]|nr:alpha/beta hydrolase-fold protein [Gemmataceae bacterium]
MKKIAWLGILVVLCVSSTDARAGWRKENELAALNHSIKGKVVDHTANHGHDRRIWSPSLGQKRDLYVYLPPNYDPDSRYPIIIFMHGFGQDEQLFLRMAPKIDEEICQGKLPPVIIAAPDGSITGEASYLQPGSFFINSNAGDFEDWVLQDMWDFVCENYPIRSERESHVLAGVSMGGFAAFSMGIRHRQAFGVAVGIHPPLNLRWVDCNGNYFANFDPRCWGWRTTLERRREPVAKFYGGLVKVRIGQLIDPLFGFNDDALGAISRQNPIELIDATHLQNGDLAMFVGYGGKDEFNIDAQVESFLYLAKCRGIGVGVAYEPYGHHDTTTAIRQWPDMVDWLAPRLAPYAPEH